MDSGRASLSLYAITDGIPSDSIPVVYSGLRVALMRRLNTVISTEMYPLIYRQEKPSAIRSFLPILPHSTENTPLQKSTQVSATIMHPETTPPKAGTPNIMHSIHCMPPTINFTDIWTTYWIYRQTPKQVRCQLICRLKLQTKTKRYAGL